MHRSVRGVGTATSRLQFGQGGIKGQNLALTFPRGDLASEPNPQRLGVGHDVAQYEPAPSSVRISLPALRHKSGKEQPGSVRA